MLGRPRAFFAEPLGASEGKLRTGPDAACITAATRVIEHDQEQMAPPHRPPIESSPRIGAGCLLLRPALALALRDQGEPERPRPPLLPEAHQSRRSHPSRSRAHGRRARPTTSARTRRTHTRRLHDSGGGATRHVAASGRVARTPMSPTTRNATGAAIHPIRRRRRTGVATSSLISAASRVERTRAATDETVVANRRS
jgi:hypothetical protein